MFSVISICIYTRLATLGLHATVQMVVGSLLRFCYQYLHPLVRSLRCGDHIYSQGMLADGVAQHDPESLESANRQGTKRKAPTPLPGRGRLAKQAHTSTTP